MRINTKHNEQQPLLSLPRDVLIQILNLYIRSGLDAVRFCSTCTTLYAIAKREPPIKLKIRLALAQTIRFSSNDASAFAWRNFSNLCLLTGMGVNHNGMLGLGEVEKIDAPTHIPLPPEFTHISQVSKGTNHVILAGTDLNGKPLIAATGRHASGQLGLSLADLAEMENYAAFIGNFTLVQLPKEFDGVIQVVAASDSSFVLGSDARGKCLLAASGQNRYGAFGTGDNKSRYNFTLVPLPEAFDQITQVVRHNSFSVICGNAADQRPLIAVSGQDVYNQFGNRLNRNVFTPIELPQRLAKITQTAIEDSNSLIFGFDFQDGPLLAATGRNMGGELGAGDNIERHGFTIVSLPIEFRQITQITFGDACSMLLGNDAEGNPIVASCGRNFRGRLGTGDNNDKNVFTIVELPKEFKKVTHGSFVSREISLLYGIDIEGKPLVAFSGKSVDDHSDVSKFTLMPFPENIFKIIQISENRAYQVIYAVDEKFRPCYSICLKPDTDDSEFVSGIFHPVPELLQRRIDASTSTNLSSELSTISSFSGN